MLKLKKEEIEMEVSLKKRIKYDDEKELIKVIYGTNSIVKDTKKLYLDLF